MSGRVKWTIAAHSTCLDHKRPCAVHALISAKGQQRTSRGPIRSPRPRASSHDGGGHLRPCPLWAKSGHETMGPDRGTGWVSRADRFAVSFVIAVCAKSYLSRACFWFRSQVQRLAIAVGIGTGTMSGQRLTHMGLRTRKIVWGGGGRGGERPNPADMVPPNWQLQPPDPNWNGKRFLSPDGSSSLAVYAFSTASEPIASHMQSVAFAKDEMPTY